MDKRIVLIYKFTTFFLFCFLSFTCFSQTDDEEIVPSHPSANDYILKIVKTYFRSNPYENGFGAFIQHLVNDPAIINKTIQKKTDTSLYSFQGQYKDYSPFGFLANRTEVRFVEKEIDIGDSIPEKDTVFIYQLLGYSYNGETGKKAVKDEYSKFNHKYGKHFDAETDEIKNGDIIIGERQDYYTPGFVISPLTVGWKKLDDFQNVFVLTIRFKIN